MTKDRFIALCSGLDEDETKVSAFISWLRAKTDFFIAPASTKYHCSVSGGLVEHTLNVYDALCKLVKDFDQEGTISERSILRAALLHDISKVNYYEKYFRNVKNDKTQKWEQIEDYRVYEPAKRFIFGSHEQNSEYIASKFFDLTTEESVAILNHHGGLGFDSSKADVSPIYNKYTLACLLHLADMIACYVTEKK